MGESWLPRASVYTLLELNRVPLPQAERLPPKSSLNSSRSESSLKAGEVEVRETEEEGRALERVTRRPGAGEELREDEIGDEEDGTGEEDEPEGVEGRRLLIPLGLSRRLVPGSLAVALA